MSIKIRGVKLEVEIKRLKTDILIVGGGAAGCYGGIKAKEISEDVDILIVEKANIKRSGCLGAGISSLNAYLNPGVSAKDFVKYVKEDSEGLIREDLVYSIAQGVNQVAQDLERWGLPIIKDKAGNYQARGRRSIKIQGEYIKPLLAKQLKKKGVRVLNRVNISNYLILDNKVKGAFGFSTRENKFYLIKAQAVICATGGAAGIYKPNNPESRPHRMWYSPFNTGAGYAMGLRAGAEMTTFEMRFIALRTKDTIAPTGVLAQEFNATQLNAKGEEYQSKYLKNSTPYRLYATLKENEKGNGPCYLKLDSVSNKLFTKLQKSFLNMSPEIILKWADRINQARELAVEIVATEPYLVGGHAQAGYWVDKNRKTTLEGLYAVGDVAGGAPKKYATGAMVEAKLAVRAAINNLAKNEVYKLDNQQIKKEFERVFAPLKRGEGFSYQQLEQRLQKIMDEYAGGISQNYKLSPAKLKQAKKLLTGLKKDLAKLVADDFYQLLRAHEVVDRVIVAQVLIEHLLYRQESRWPGYQKRLDYPKRDDKNWFKFVNSQYDRNLEEVKIIEREPHEVKLNDN